MPRAINPSRFSRCEVGGLLLGRDELTLVPMLRNPSSLGPFASRLTALGLLGLAGCAPIESSESTGDPVVGRLKFNDRVVDLTPAAFADGPNSVPKNAIGQIIADIDLRETTPDVAKRSETSHEDQEDPPRGRGLRR